MKISLSLAILFTYALGPISFASAQDGATTTIPGAGTFEAPIRLLTEMQFTEGPAADAQGNVYFTDIPANTIYKVDLAGQRTTFTDKARHANGLMFRRDGQLVACEMDGQIAVWDVSGKQRRVIVEGHQGNRFNACNDLALDQHGGVYLSDPHFRSPRPLPQGTMAVYYADDQGNTTRLIDDLPAPNGVMLSPDEKTLYVCPSGQAEMMAYPIDAPGKIGGGRVFCRLTQAEGEENRGADGLALDAKGNLYITSGLGLQVFDPAGKLLGVISIPERPSNVTFGGKNHQTLYVTARTSLYTIATDAQGHRRFREKASGRTSDEPSGEK